MKFDLHMRLKLETHLDLCWRNIGICPKPRTFALSRKSSVVFYSFVIRRHVSRKGKCSYKLLNSVISICLKT